MMRDNNTNSASLVPIITEKALNVNADSVIAKAEKIKLTTGNMRKCLSALAYSRKQSEKAFRISTCGNYMEFRKYMDVDATTKLQRANFCKNPLCPMCAWRAHVRSGIQLRRAIELLNPSYVYHIILGIPNISALCAEDVRKLHERARSFITRKLGLNDYIVSMEVAYSEVTGWHPHVHAIVTTNSFIKQTKSVVHERAKAWAKWYDNQAQAQQYTCYIKGGSMRNVEQYVAEVTKYIFKPLEESATVEIVEALSDAIHNTRKFNAGGELRKAMQAVKREAEKESIIKEYELINSGTPYEVQVSKWMNDKYKSEIRAPGAQDSADDKRRVTVYNKAKRYGII